MASGIGAETELFGRRQAGGLMTIINRTAITGTILFVDASNTAATDSASYGNNPKDRPLATIDYAIGLATASKGDVIFAMPGHTETLAADIAVDKKGLSIIGLGMGNDKPTLTFDTTTDEINVSVDSCLIKNFRLVSGVNNLANFIDVAAHFCTIEDCDFVTSNTFEAYAGINLTTTYDHLTIKNCTATQPTDPAGTNAAAGTGFLFCVDSEFVTMDGCRITGNWETAIIHNRTTLVHQLIVTDCVWDQRLADGLHFVLVANSTGACIRTNGRNINATDVTLAKLVGTIGTDFWLSADSFFGNDSGGGGQLQVVGDAATT